MRRKLRPFVACALAAALAAFVLFPAPAAEKNLPAPELMQAMVNEISGESAFAYTARISQFDRIQASDGWHDAAVWIKTELDRMGYKDALIEGWPSNGSTRYYTYRTPIGWRARSAELWLTSPRRERLCSFQEMPLTLIKHSGTAHVEAELVDVGAGDGEASYRGKEVRGKIVLATGSPGAVAQEAVIKRGALGMIGWYTPDVRPGYPNMVRYTAFWPRWEDRDRIGFGFNVSKLQGWLLKQMLEQGAKVALRADVEAEFYETTVEVLSASLPGTEEPHKEVLLVAHLCHPAPSANDNASGSGGLLEMARALKKMVDAGIIPPPKRTIRFLWVPEFAGTVPYVRAHLERVRNTLAVINCDMIGENLAKTGGAFTITRTPDSLPSFLNDVAVHFTRVVDALNLRSMNGSDNPFAFRVSRYSGGSDHVVFNDGALRAPALMFGHGDTFHHTSLDTMDKVDASELRRVCTIALAALYYIASAGDREAVDMARLIARNAVGRVSEDYYDSLAALEGAGDADGLAAAYGQVLNVIAHAARRETEAVRSTLAFAGESRAAARIDGLTATIAAVAEALRADARKAWTERAAALGVKPLPRSPSATELALSRVVPVRAADFACHLDESYLDEKLGAGTARGLKLRGNQAYEALNFVDGRRSVTDIALAVSAEYGPVAVEDVHAYFQVLERAGLLSLREFR